MSRNHQYENKRTPPHTHTLPTLSLSSSSSSSFEAPVSICKHFNYENKTLELKESFSCLPVLHSQTNGNSLSTSGVAFWFAQFCPKLYLHICPSHENFGSRTGQFNIVKPYLETRTGNYIYTLKMGSQKR